LSEGAEAYSFFALLAFCAPVTVAVLFTASHGRAGWPLDYHTAGGGQAAGKPGFFALRGSGEACKFAV